MIRQWGMAPLGCIGIVLNLIALWAWTAEREFKPLTFYIKCLAVSDILYMLFYMSVYDLNSLGQKSRGHSFVSMFIAFRWMIVFSTTCIAIYQYTKLFHPDIARRFTFRCSAVAMTLYFLLGVLYVLFLIYLRNEKDSHIFFSIDNITFSVVPTFLQVVLIGRVMYELSRINRQIQSEPRQQSQPEASQISGMYKITSKEDRKKQRQLTYALCHITFWSFLAFGIMTLMSVIMRVAYPNEFETGVWRVFKAVMNIVLYINCSVNFFFFYFLVADFRNLLYQRISSLQALLSDTGTIADDSPCDFNRTQ
jgi:hypothetical protein